jgi:hypothetical protein
MPSTPLSLYWRAAGRPGGSETGGAPSRCRNPGPRAPAPAGGTTPGRNGTTTGTITGTGVARLPCPANPILNPAGLDPDRQPQVKDLVREWLATAESERCARRQFRYDELGRKIGGGGNWPRDRVTRQLITARFLAEAQAGPRYDTARFHGTHGEYVIARLQDRQSRLAAPCRPRSRESAGRSSPGQARLQVTLLGRSAPRPGQDRGRRIGRLNTNGAGVTLVVRPVRPVFWRLIS